MAEDARKRPAAKRAVTARKKADVEQKPARPRKSPPRKPEPGKVAEAAAADTRPPEEGEAAAPTAHRDGWASLAEAVAMAAADASAGEVETKELCQLVTFLLDGEVYGFPIMNVQEILRMRTVHVTPIPNAVEFIEGVMNLRGKVIPVVDLRTRFRMPAAERGRANRVIVVEVCGRVIGVVVDAVVEVTRMDMDSVEPLPELASGIGSEFIVGVSRAGGGMVILLDMERVFSAEEKATMDELVA